MTTPVSFEIAKLLKEKRFEERTKSYNEDGKLVTVSLTIRRFNPKKIYYPSPTISEIVMWLYEKHEIWIQVKPGGKLESWDYIIQKKDNNFAVPYFEIKQHKPFFNSLTKAYEAAIEYTLNNLI